MPESFRHPTDVNPIQLANPADVRQQNLLTEIAGGFVLKSAVEQGKQE
jgi:hypothetical protein